MVSTQSTCWMDAVQCRGVVGQRKLLDVVSGKRNVSKVSPGMGWQQYDGFGILNTGVHGSMVVNTASPHHCSPGSNPWRSLTNYIFSQRNWRVEAMRSRITSLVMVTSACSCVERERLRVREKWNWCVLADCAGWVVNVF